LCRHPLPQKLWLAMPAPKVTDRMFLVFDRVATVVGGVLRDVFRFFGDVHHGNECDAEVDSQAVDVEETEERQSGEDNSTRRELYKDTPVNS